MTNQASKPCRGGLWAADETRSSGPIAQCICQSMLQIYTPCNPGSYLKVRACDAHVPRLAGPTWVA